MKSLYNYVHCSLTMAEPQIYPRKMGFYQPWCMAHVEFSRFQPTTHGMVAMLVEGDDRCLNLA